MHLITWENEMDAPITTLRRTTAQRIRRLTPEQAAAALAEIRADGVTIFHPAIRALTGGFNSQSINTYVVRKLAVRAGLITA